MIKVILKPLDDFLKTVEITEGKTVLGRGALLNCKDPKVSRHHAILEVNADGAIFLTSTHANPCYHRTKSEKCLKMMTKDEALRLEAGDVFSLLPLSFQYQVLLPEDNKPEECSKGVMESIENIGLKKDESRNETLKNLGPLISPAKEALPAGLSECGKRNCDSADVDGELSSPKPKRTTIQRNPNAENERCESASGPSECPQNTYQRTKRTLPGWLINSASTLQNHVEDAPPKGGKNKGRGNTNKPRDFQGESSSSGMTSTTGRQKVRHKASESDNSEPETRPGKNTPARKYPKEKRSPKKLRSESEEDEENWESEDENSEKEMKKNTAPVARNACQFGRKCYRKNPSHLKMFSHPGDSDYDSPGEEIKSKASPNTSKRKKKRKVSESDHDSNGSDESPSQKPECPYGSACYRKNPQHKRDYLHTKKTRSKRSVSKSAGKTATVYKDDDSDDALRDITSDDDASDYVPDDDD